MAAGKAYLFLLFVLFDDWFINRLSVAQFDVVAMIHIIYLLQIHVVFLFC